MKRPIFHSPANRLFLLLAFCFAAFPAHALILYTGDNSANQTTPGNGAPFYAVARVSADGGGSTAGSAVYIRGKYLLTANHVENRSHVTFDGNTFWARDTAFTPVQIGSSDMKLIKLLKDPDLAEVPLFDQANGDISTSVRIRGELVLTEVIGTLVGWGRGRDPSIADAGTGTTRIWTWGDNTTLAKRWGTNRIESTTSLTYNGYSYAALVTHLNSDAGNNEAGTTLYDSGSGIFIEHEGTWKLAGLAATVSTNGSSTFGATGDKNYFVRIGSYAADIEAAIPDTTIYSDWAVDHGLYGADAEPTADPDGDGVPNLLEFAFGGNPQVNDSSVLPQQGMTTENGETYLEITFTRPIDITGVTYTVKTTTDVASWPTDSTGIDSNPLIIDNGDGTESLTFRRSQPVSDFNKAFIRVSVTN